MPVPPVAESATRAREHLPPLLTRVCRLRAFALWRVLGSQLLDWQWFDLLDAHSGMSCVRLASQTIASPRAVIPGHAKVQKLVPRAQETEVRHWICMTGAGAAYASEALGLTGLMA